MRKQWLIIIVIGMVVALVILFMGRAAKLTTGEAFASNIRYPTIINDNEYNYFSGSAFVRYKLGDQSTESLTPYYRFPGVTAVKWSARGVLFHAINYTPADELYGILKANHLPTDQGYWWQIKFEDGEIRLVGGIAASEVIDVTWQDELGTAYLMLLTEYDELDQPLHRVADDGVATIIGSTQGVSKLVGANKEKIITISDNPDDDQFTLSGYNLETMQPQVISTKTGGEAWISSGGESILFLDNSLNVDEVNENPAATGDLTYYSFAQAEPVVIEKKFTGSATWRPGSKEWFALSRTESANQRGLGGEGKQVTKKYKVVNSDKTAKFLSLGGMLDTEKMLVLDVQGLAFLAAKDGLVLKSETLKNINKLEESIFLPKFQIFYIKERGVYWVYILNNPYSTSQNEAVDYIRNLGIDPNQINIQWIPGDRVNP